MTTVKLCECGCGQPTPLATRNRAERGWVKGEPLRYINGHHGRRNRSASTSSTAGNVADSDMPDGAIHIETDATGANLETGKLDHPLNLARDWSELLAKFGLDPDLYEVVDDTVKIGTWQQSKALEDGSRDMVQLWSYKARFRRKTIADRGVIDVDEVRKYVRSWATVDFGRTREYIAIDEAPCTFVVGWADWQLGKSAGGGVEATIRKIRESFELTAARLEALRRDHNIERVAVINMGDPTESCYGQYASQLFTVEMTQREQLNLALDLWLEGVRILQPDIFASVLCNHGEWTRPGTGERAVTSDSDNVSGYLADTLQRVLEGRPESPTEWYIPHDNMVTPMMLSGVPVAACHGHKIKTMTKEHEWLDSQSIMLLRRRHIDPRIWLTAHFHHLRMDDMGAFWRIQHPTLDGGSKWFEDTTGQWSTPGTATYLIGNHDVRGWSDLAVLGTYSSEGMAA